MNGCYESKLGNFPKALELYVEGEGADLRALKIQYFGAWVGWEQTGMTHRPPKPHWKADDTGLNAASVVNEKEVARWKKNGWYKELPDMSGYGAKAHEESYNLREVNRGEEFDNPAGDLKGIGDIWGK
jgi:hypothetical protein